MGVLKEIIFNSESIVISDTDLRNVECVTVVINSVDSHSYMSNIFNRLINIFCDILHHKPTKEIKLKKVVIKRNERRCAMWLYSDVGKDIGLKTLLYTLGLFKNRLDVTISSDVTLIYKCTVFAQGDVNFGNIRTLRLKFIHDTDKRTHKAPVLNICFSAASLVGSLITKVEVVNEDNAVIRGTYDKFDICNKIFKGSTNVSTRQSSSKIALALRSNQDLVNNFHNIRIIFYYIWKKTSMNILSKDIFFYILSFINVRDWEGKITIKNPAWTNNVIKAYKSIITANDNITLTQYALDDKEKFKVKCKTFLATCDDDIDHLKTDIVKNKRKSNVCKRQIEEIKNKRKKLY